MFGYVKIYPPELKIKDYNKYKAYYCGLCNVLKEQHGRLGQITLTYDMTFLIILLNSLYEREIKKNQKRCLIHPIKKRNMIYNEITEYVGDMNILLTYYHLLDDWQDEKSLPGLAGTKILKKDYEKIFLKYPRQCQEISNALNRLQICEINNETDIDTVSGCFGELMAELFVYRQDLWESSLRKIGFFLGKFIYIIDAYEDLEKDIKNNNYNPLKSISNNRYYEDDCKNMLIMMMGECTKEFEKLPCLSDIDILRNILYDGVWAKYNLMQKQKNLRKEQKNDSKSL